MEKNNTETDIAFANGNYDYKILRVLREQEEISTDTYACHGYQLIHSQLVDPSLPYIDLSFQRSKKYAKNKELLKLDKDTGKHLEKLAKLNIELDSKGFGIGLIFAIIGLLILVMGLSLVFLWQDSNIIFICGIISIILGIILILISIILTKIIHKESKGKIKIMMKNEESIISDMSLRAINIIEKEDSIKISQKI
ncbi:MAG: hypothetical protein PHW22_01750 [Bacilli bacterium]|nr:hypothetical protein [Bacilli bacterium]